MNRLVLMISKSTLNKITDFGPSMVIKAWNGTKHFGVFLKYCANTFNKLPKKDTQTMDQLADNLHAGKATIADIVKTTGNLQNAQQFQEGFKNIMGPGSKIVVESGIPNSTFYNMTGIAVAITMGLGAYFFIKLKPNWEKTFEQKEE